MTTDWRGLLSSIARRGPGLPTLCSLLVGRNALPEHPVHIKVERESQNCVYSYSSCQNASPFHTSAYRWLAGAGGMTLAPPSGICEIGQRA